MSGIPDTSSIMKLAKSRYKLIVAVLILLADLAPYYIFGHDMHIGLHDTYDSIVIWYEVLAKSGMLFAPNDAIVPGIMNGLPRICFGTEFYGYLWLFIFLDPYWASVVNITLAYFIGFAGMYLLLKKHFLTDSKHDLIVIGSALCFGLLQFRPTGGLGLSMPTLPLALYAFLNIRNGEARKRDWALLLLIPFNASLVYAYAFLLSLVGLLWLVDIIRTKTVNREFTGSLFLMGSVFLLVEYRLVTGMLLGSDFVSHRTIFDPASYSILESLEKSAEMFFLGQYHAISLHGVGVLLTVVLALGLVASYKKRNLQKPFMAIGILAAVVAGFAMLVWYPTSIIPMTRYALALLPQQVHLPLVFIGVVVTAAVLVQVLWSFFSDPDTQEENGFQHRRLVQAMVTILAICVVIALWAGLWDWELWTPLKNEYVVLKVFTFHRFYRLFPMLWYIIFALALAIIQRGPSFRSIPTDKILVLALIGLQVGVIMPYNWAMVSRGVGNQDVQVSYREFYAEDLFAEIKQDIGLSQEDYRVINIGMHPALAQHSGFHTLDGYLNNYPLEYKLQFRNIIAYELAKNEELESYYDGWGSRCYTFVAELDKYLLYTKSKSSPLENLELNVTALYEMNCSYVFSAVEIPNPEDSNLTLFNDYVTPESVWHIFVYEVV